MFNLTKPLVQIFVLISAFYITIHDSFASDLTVYAVSAENGIQISYNDGKSWDSLNKGLPSGCAPLRLYLQNKAVYLSTFSSGIFRLENEKWMNMNSPDFRRRSIYSKDAGYRKISAFAADPENSSNLAVATKHTIYKSSDGGKNWIPVSMPGFNKRNYITALAVSGKMIYAGTSFNGVFESGGAEFKPSGKGLPFEPYSGTMTFTEQLSYLFADKTELYTGFQFGGGIYLKNRNSKNFSVIAAQSDNNFNSIIFDIKKSGEKLYYTDGKKTYLKDISSISSVSKYDAIIDRISKKNDILTAAIYDNSGTIPPLTYWIGNPDRKIRSSAAEKKAIYASIPAIQKNLQKYIEITKNTEIDSIIIDMKDDFGNIYFPSESKTAAEIKSVKRPVNLKGILEKLKKNNIHSIARIVTFKDEKLFNGYNGKYAIKNKSTGFPWKGTKDEFWVDPYSEFVQNYNIELAKELEKAGFDEIQFDYIRFPSDGPTHLCKFSFQTDAETYKSEILIDFLKKAKQSLNIPVSVDIYGFNSWYYFGNWIGQDMEELSYTVDVICPMVYPSHFGSSFYKKFPVDVRPYRIVRDGGIRALKMLNRSAALRPYLQGFNLLSPTWGTGYINSQIRAASESGCSGYSFWNANGDYTVPVKALKEKK